MSDIFFSVIIPVYKVEAYLPECIDSVLRQSFRNFEIILVDDGSPDSCPGICDAYAARDPRITVIHKPNGGLSDARNCGIRKASGDYLMFLDSDDYWDDSGALRTLHNQILSRGKMADIVIFQAKLLYPDGSIRPDRGQFTDSFNDLTPEDALVYLSQNGLLIGSACSKAVRRTFLVDNGLFFKVGIKSEDIHWILRLANCMPKYQYSDQYFYIYRKGRNDSITSTEDLAYLTQFADMLEEFSDTFVYSSDTVRNCLMALVAYEFSILMAKAANLPESVEKKQLTQQIKTMRHILAYDMHPKVRKIHMVEKLLGFDLVMRLLGTYLKYRKR